MLGHFLVAYIWGHARMKVLLEKPRWNHGPIHGGHVGHACLGTNAESSRRPDANRHRAFVLP